MRINIVGNNPASRTLKGYIEHLGYLVTENTPTFTVILEESGKDFIVDGIDSVLERRILYHLEDLGVEKFILQRAGGVRSADSIRVEYPSGKDEIVARSIARAVQEAYLPKQPVEPPKASIWDRVKKLLATPVFFLLLATPSYSQQFIYGRAWDTVNLAGVDAGDSTNRAIRVNCIVGCGAGSGATGIQVRSGGGTWTDVGYAGGNLKVPVTPDPITFASAQPVTQSGTWNIGTLTSITNTVSTNLSQVGGNATAVDIGDRSNGTQRILKAGTPNLAVNQVSCATTATLIANSRAGRQGISVTNLGTTDVYVGGASVTTGNGDLILGVKGANASYDTSGALYCIVGTGTQSVSYVEVY